ncbi:MAG: hypothetical protein AB4038_17210 [Prochloraceae cyanobacterium]
MTEDELLQVIEQAATQGTTELDLSGNKFKNLARPGNYLRSILAPILRKFPYHLTPMPTENYYFFSQPYLLTK